MFTVSVVGVVFELAPQGSQFITGFAELIVPERLAVSIGSFCRNVEIRSFRK